MLKTILFILKIIFLVVRIPAFLIMGLMNIMDGSAHAEVGYTYISLSLWTGFIVIVTNIISLVKPYKYDQTIFLGLLLLDAIFFYLISISFPYANSFSRNQDKGLSLFSIIVLALTVMGQFFSKQNKNA